MTSPEGRFYTPLTLCLAVLLIVLSLRLTVAMLTTLYGPFTLGAAAPPKPIRYGVWRVDDDVANEVVGVARRVASWQRIFERAHEEDAEFVEAESLEALVDQEATVVVIPAGRTLSSDETSALVRFVDEGGGALLIGSLGTTDEAGRWRGYEIMQHLLAVEAVAPRSRDASSALEIGRSDDLLSGRFGPRERLPLLPEQGVAAVENPGAELLWNEDAASGPRAASLRTVRGRGRLVWLGAGPESSVVGNASALRMYDTLYLDALRWAARRPAVSLLASSGRDFDRLRPVTPLRVRERVHAWVHVEGRYRLRIEVTNRSDRPARDIVLRLYFNRDTGDARIARTTIGQTLPEVERAESGAWLDLAMAEVAAGESFSLLVDTPETSW